MKLIKSDYFKLAKGKKVDSVVFESLDFIKDILITLVVVFIIISFVAQPTTVDGESMSPTLHNGNQLIIEKMSYHFVGYERYDIIVFPYLKEADKYYIKRIIGLPGETINIVNGYVYIDGARLEEPRELEKITDYGSKTLPVTIPDGYYFVMGDNRNHSQDSRYTDVGFIKERDILGKGSLRLYPFRDFGMIN